MKAVIVAAGAALIGSAVASSHVKKVHERLHARSDWSELDGSSTPVVDTKTTTTTWSGDWPTSSSAPVVDTSKTTTSGWDWTSSSTPVVATSKTTTTSSFSNYWGDWSSSSSTTPVKAATTTSDPWSDWSSATPVVATSTSTDPWADWSSSSSTPVVATSTASVTWQDWSSKATDPATSTETWGEWSETESVVVTTIHTTTTKTIWLGAASTPVVATTASSWADWSSASSSTPVVVASTASSWAGWSSASSSTPVVATSIVQWSSAGWFGAPWPTSESMCVQQILTSYGAPTWYPTPKAASTPVASSSSASWADWSSTSSKPVVATSSSSSGWADWSSTTSSKPVVATTTTSASWADWSSTTPAAVTSTSAAWNSASSSASWGAGFYQASSSSSAGWSSPSGSSSSGSGQLKSNGNYFGMTYSPYTNSGGCKDAGTVSNDIWQIAAKGFTTVRVYSTDCNTLENVGNAAKANNLKIILGVFISSTGISGAQGQVTDITRWAQWDLVELIVVGNEAVFNGYCSASELAGFISSSKWAFQAAGYTGAVTTTEPLDTWQSSGSSFCGVVDVVAANLYAFFNAQTTADKAGDLIQAQIGILEGICSGKETYVMESGWPSAGNCNGAACPSPENQVTALKGIQATSGAKVVFFSFEDEAWKAGGEFGVEQHWGCINVF